jgi:hypothetical protein
MTMSCTLATMAACFSMSGVYVDTGLDYQDAGEWRWTQKTETVQVQSMSEGGETFYHPLQYRATVVDSRAQNPYARLGLGYQMNLDMGQSKVILTLLAYHQSSIATGNDRGVNGLSFGARYFPFSRQ